MNRSKTLLVALALALPVPAAIAGCGGGDSSSSQDPQAVLDATFSNDNQIDSGVLDLNLDLSAQGSQGGSLTLNVNGPFAMNPDDPNGIGQLDLDISASGDGAAASALQDFQAGVTVTNDNLYVNYGGTDYELGTQQFQQLKQQSEAASGASSSSTGSTFKDQCEQAIEAQGGDKAACDFDVTAWFTDLSNDGTEDKGGAQATHVSGSLNVQQMVSDLFNLGASVPGATGGTDPSQIEPFLGVIDSAISNATFDVWSATDDGTLRGLDLSLGVDPSSIPGASGAGIDSANLDFALEISDVGSEQTFTAPDNPQPITDLAQQFGGLGAIPGGSSVPGLGGTSGSSIPDATCIANAQGNPDEIQKCLG